MMSLRPGKGVLKRGNKGLSLGLLQLAFVELDGILITKVQRVADEGVSDGNFFEARDITGEELKVVKIEIMTGVEAKAEPDRVFCGSAVGGNGFFPVREVLMRVGFGVEFDAIGSGGGGAFYHRDDGVDEKGYADAGFLECFDYIF